MTDKTVFCTKCKETKSSSCFTPSTRRKCGYRHHCKDCRKLERPHTRRTKTVMDDWVIRAMCRTRRRAKVKGFGFSLTEKYLRSIAHNKCPVLGVDLDYSARDRGATTPSLERIDNTLGYIRGNVCIISLRANALKRDASIQEMEKVLRWYRNTLPLVPFFIKEYR